MRNSLAHDDKPSINETVAGVAAMRDVLQAYGDQPTGNRLGKIVEEIQSLAWLEDGSTVEMTLHDNSFAAVMLEASLEEMSTTLGQRICEHWHPLHAAPSMPMEANAVAAKLRNSKKKGQGDGKNSNLIQVSDARELMKYMNIDCFPSRIGMRTEAGTSQSYKQLWRQFRWPAMTSITTVPLQWMSGESKQ